MTWSLIVIMGVTGLGLAMVIHGAIIWKRGSGKILPHAIGLVTGGLGYFVAWWLLGHVEIRGWGARSYAISSLCYGVMFTTVGTFFLVAPLRKSQVASVPPETTTSQQVAEAAPGPNPQAAEQESAPAPQAPTQAMAVVEKKEAEPKPKASTMQPMPKNWRPEGLRPIGVD